MPRKRKFNLIVTKESQDNMNPQNRMLIKEFLGYLKAVDKAHSTVEQYENDLNIFFAWNYHYNDNKKFTAITKRDFLKFQNHSLSEWEWSPKRLRREKAVISSMSNFIENMLDEDDEFKGFRSVINKIESPPDIPVLEKTIFEEEELKSLLDTLVEAKRFAPACALSLAMSSGRRKAELTRFKVSYFDEKNVIHGSLYKTPEMVVTKGRSSKGKPMYLYTLKHEFDPYLKLWLEERKAKGIESIWLFPKQYSPNEHISTETLDGWAEQFNRVTEKEFYWHSIRHYMTTYLIKRHIPDSVIKDLIGWESSEMVSVYNDMSADDMLGWYFDENGIKDIKPTSVAQL